MRAELKIREALTWPASHRLRPSPPVPTARQPSSGVTPEVHLTSFRRPRARAFESATFAGRLAPPELFVAYAALRGNPETQFEQTADDVDHNVWITGGQPAAAVSRCSFRRNSPADSSARSPSRGAGARRSHRAPTQTRPHTRRSPDGRRGGSSRPCRRPWSVPIGRSGANTTCSRFSNG